MWEGMGIGHKEPEVGGRRSEIRLNESTDELIP